MKLRPKVELVCCGMLAVSFVFYRRVWDSMLPLKKSLGCSEKLGSVLVGNQATVSVKKNSDNFDCQNQCLENMFGQLIEFGH